MSRCRMFLVLALVALVALAVAAPSVSAQSETQMDGSCLGTLSAFAGAVRDDTIYRQDYAPAAGDLVVGIAEQKGDLGFCASLLPTP